MVDSIIEPIAEQLHIQPTQVKQTLALLEEGNTVPFIARVWMRKKFELFRNNMIIR